MRKERKIGPILLFVLVGIATSSCSKETPNKNLVEGVRFIAMDGGLTT